MFKLSINFKSQNLLIKLVYKNCEQIFLIFIPINFPIPNPYY